MVLPSPSSSMAARTCAARSPSSAAMSSAYFTDFRCGRFGSAGRRTLKGRPVAKSAQAGIASFVGGRSGALRRAVALDGKEQLVAVGVVHLDGIVPPPGLLAGHRPLLELSAKLRELGYVQLDEQARPVPAR